MEDIVENLENLINYIVKELVETKEKVNITYEILDSTVTFKVMVEKGEMGKIIGKNGLTANAIRGVMQAAGVKDKLNVNVEFLD
jgi:RNA-binding protein